MSSDRKAELARKRKKLEELKKQREQRHARRSHTEEPTGATTAEVDVTTLVDSVLGLTTGDDDSRPPVSPIRQRRRVELVISEVKHTDIPPAEKIEYSKSVQTDPIAELENSQGQDADEVAEEERLQREAAALKQERTQAAIDAKAEQIPEPEPEKPQELSSEAAREILQKPDFADFFDKSSRLVERALNQPYDVLVDYAMDIDETEEDVSVSESVKLNVDFYHSHWSSGRAITSIDWDPKHPELIAAAYNANPESPNDPDGIVMVWNAQSPSRHEFLFECQSAVLSTCFSPFQPNILVGGTYSGQIVLWDNRTKKTPVQRSALSTDSHTHPVYCVDIVGTQNAHNLITISTDGKMCSWNLDMLTTPQDVLELQYGAAKAVAATTFSFPSGDINNFVVGSEEGAVYSASRHGQKGGVQEIFEAHSGPVTGIDFHPSASGSSDFSHLFLTSSTDWTVKLWSFRDKKPIHSFENSGDYVYDVQWSPTHPSLFVTADGLGNLDFWNLNLDTEVPIVSRTVGDGRQALNKIKWNKDGKSLAVGTVDGHLLVYNVGEKLSSPRSDEGQQLKDSLADLQQAAQETAAR